LTMETVATSGEDSAALSELSLHPEKTKFVHRESGETVRCSDFSSKPSSSSTEQLLVSSSDLVVAENQKLKHDLVIITADRDSLQAELTALKMEVAEFRASAKEDEPNKKEKGNSDVPESPKSGGTATFRSSFRLPSFMISGGNDKDKLLDDSDLDLDLLSIDSSIGVGSKKAQSMDSLSSAGRRTSLFAKFFGSTDLEHTIHEEEHEEPEKSGESILDWKRNKSKPKRSTKPGPRSSLFKTIFGGEEKVSESSSDVDSDISEAEAKDEVPEDRVVKDVSKKARRSSTRLQRLAAERRNKRESIRVSKNFNLPEDEVEGLKSCLKSRQAPNTKPKVMFRESIIQVRRVSKIRGSAWDDCFFTEEELADFKYEAFLEECGLSDDDF
jgi:hypothetical protein